MQHFLISPKCFLTSFLQGLKSINLFDKGSTLSPMTNFHCSKLKAFADDKINATEKVRFVMGRLENIVGKGRKCWLPAFFHFPTMFSKAVVKSRDCLGRA